MTNVAVFGFNQWKMALKVQNEIINRELIDSDSKVYFCHWKKSLFRDPGYLNSNLFMKLLRYDRRPTRVIEKYFNFSNFEEVALTSSNENIDLHVKNILSNLESLEINEILKIKFAGRNLGNSIISTLGTHFGFSTTSNSRYSSFTLRKMIKSYVLVYFAALETIDTHGIEKVYLFNGRYLHDKAVENACKAKGVNFFTYEVSEDNEGYYLVKDSNLFNPKAFAKLAKLNYDLNISSINSEELVATWFKAKVDSFSFYENLKKSKDLMDGIYQYFINNDVLTYFSSSVDEAMFIENEYLSFYENQERAITELSLIIREYFPKLKFAVRSHPRLISRPKSELIEWNSFVESLKPDIHIDSSMNVNSYDLITLTKYVALYKSSIGLESLHLGKKPLILGFTNYCDLPDFDLVRKSEDIIDFIARETRPVSKEGLVSYLLYFENSKIVFKNDNLQLNSNQKVRTFILKYESFIYLKFHHFLHTVANLKLLTK